jgi:uncharacterized membrane protein HdeD (DUF308 family)
VSILAILFGIYWIVEGIVEIIAAIDYPSTPGRAVRIFLGVLAITAGTIVLVWPEPTLLVLAILLGVWLILFGFVQIFLGFGVRAAAEAA